MTLLSAPGSLTLTAVRNTVSGYLPGSCVIEAFNPIADGYGGFSEQWTAVTNGTVPCRIDPINFAQIETLALSEGVKVEYHITVPYTAPLVVGRRIRDVTGQPLTNGTYAGGTPYNVRIMQPNITQIAFIRALVSRDQ